MKIKYVECICRPESSAPVNPCYSRVYEQIVLGKFDLTCAWRGWKVRGDGKLVGPGGIKFGPSHLSMLWSLRKEVLEAMMTDAFEGPTVLKKLDRLRVTAADVANDDRFELESEPIQVAFNGF